MRTKLLKKIRNRFTIVFDQKKCKKHGISEWFIYDKIYSKQVYIYRLEIKDILIELLDKYFSNRFMRNVVTKNTKSHEKRKSLRKLKSIIITNRMVKNEQLQK